MITSNTSIPFIKSENSENKFYLSRLTSEYNEGDSITTSTAINCRKLAIAIKAGDKITINGTSLTVYADAAVDATSFFIEAITLDEALNINANIAIDEDNMFVQYQRKTEGTVAGFDIDADGMSKGGVEITGWLDSDTMEGATENNIPTAQSVKAYVDGQVGASDTLQEVTDNGNTTTNSVMIGSSSSPADLLHIADTVSDNALVTMRAENSNGYAEFGTQSGYSRILSGGYLLYAGSYGVTYFYVHASTAMTLNNTGLGIGTTSPSYPLHVVTESTSYAAYIKNTDNNGGGLIVAAANGGGGTNTILSLRDKNDNPKVSVIENGNVGIGTTRPSAKLQVDEYTVGSQGSQSIFGNLSSFSNSGSENLFLGIKDATYPNRGWAFNPVTNGVNSDLVIKEHGSTGERLRIKTGGNVGIGTTSPSQLLELKSANPRLRLINSDDNERVEIGDSAGNGGFLDLTNNANTKNIILRSYGISYFNGGNVGIGTTSPTYKLDVNGTQRVQDVLELDDVLTLNAISTPDDPADGKSSIYMDSADGNIKVKINVGGEVVTRTIASYDG